MVDMLLVSLTVWKQRLHLGWLSSDETWSEQDDPQKESSHLLHNRNPRCWHRGFTPTNFAYTKNILSQHCDCLYSKLIGAVARTNPSQSANTAGGQHCSHLPNKSMAHAARTSWFIVLSLSSSSRKVTTSMWATTGQGYRHTTGTSAVACRLHSGRLFRRAGQGIWKVHMALETQMTCCMEQRVLEPRNQSVFGKRMLRGPQHCSAITYLMGALYRGVIQPGLEQGKVHTTNEASSPTPSYVELALPVAYSRVSVLLVSPVLSTRNPSSPSQCAPASDFDEAGELEFCLAGILNFCSLLIFQAFCSVPILLVFLFSPHPPGCCLVMKIVLGLIPSSIRSFIKEQKNGKEELTEEKRHEIAQKIIAKTLKLADPPERSKWRTSAERFRKKLAPAVTRVAGAGVAHVRDVVSMPARFSFADAGGRLSTEGFSSSRRFSDVGLFGHSKRHVRGDETLSLLDVE